MIGINEDDRVYLLDSELDTLDQAEAALLNYDSPQGVIDASRALLDLYAQIASRRAAMNAIVCNRYTTDELLTISA